MTTAVEHELPAAAALAAATTAGFASIPPQDGWSAEPLHVADLAGVDGRAITAEVEGMGQLVIVGKRALASSIELDMPGVSFADALCTAARNVVGALGLPGALGDVTETEGAAMLATIDTSAAVAVTLLDGEAPRATIVIGRRLDDGPTPSAPSPTATVAAAAASFAAQPTVPHAAPTVSHSFDPLPSPPPAIIVGNHSVGILSDVQMGVTVELGRTRMSVREILGLTLGSVIELDRPAGAPVDLFVNGTLIARGEVVVIDEEFGIRVSEVMGYPPPGSAVR